MNDSTFGYTAALQSVTRSSDRLVGQVQEQCTRQDVQLTEISPDPAAVASMKDLLKGHVCDCPPDRQPGLRGNRGFEHCLVAGKVDPR